ncbi:MAG: tetraacyldisaccharide 4'-kinase, partial [Gammaproteobacteria bacterium]|nr:tetraacyldisaccharide 4'-kinase [Gammaproteobacteria bacterium]
MALEREWLRRGALAWLLYPLSIAFALVAAARRGLYRAGLLKSQRFDRPIIVVGNVIAGGSGKTPVVMAIARHLERQGFKTGVVSRGYGRTTRDCREVHRDSDPAEVGDEPLLIRRSTTSPVFVARERVQAVEALLSAYPATRIVLCDDGLQHLALSRDIEICVFDDRGTGNGWLLPAGPLREHWPRRCDLILHTGKQPAFEGFTSRRSLADHAVGQDGKAVALGELAGRPVIAVAAIASPESFFEMLRERGVVPEH